MVRRVRTTRNLFLTADGVATRLAIKELKKARIDPGPLLAKAGVSLLRNGLGGRDGGSAASLTVEAAAGAGGANGIWNRDCFVAAHPARASRMAV